MIKNKGFTLIETLIASILFSAIAIIFFVVFKLGLQCWKETDSKLQSEKSINLATIDLNYAIRNSQKKEIQIENLTNGNSWMALSSASKAEYKKGITTIYENDVNYIVEENASDLNWAFKIVYFTTKMEDNCPYCKDLNLTKVCPHKILVKRYYALDDEYKDLELLSYENTNDYTVNSLKFNTLTQTKYSRQAHDRILAKNVIAFIPKTTSEGIRYSLKIFNPKNVTYALKDNDFIKTIEAINYDKDGKLETSIAETNTDEYYDDVNKDPLSKFTTQINYTAIPLN